MSLPSQCVEGKRDANGFAIGFHGALVTRLDVCAVCTEDFDVSFFLIILSACACVTIDYCTIDSSTDEPSRGELAVRDVGLDLAEHQIRCDHAANCKALSSASRRNGSAIKLGLNHGLVARLNAYRACIDLRSQKVGKRLATDIVTHNHTANGHCTPVGFAALQRVVLAGLPGWACTDLHARDFTSLGPTDKGNFPALAPVLQGDPLGCDLDTTFTQNFVIQGQGIGNCR